MIARYALYNKKTKCYLGFYTMSNPPDSESCPVQFVLDDDKYMERIWMTNSWEKAEFVRTHSTEWYNADYSSPTNDYDPEILEVRKLEFPS